MGRYQFIEQLEVLIRKAEQSPDPMVNMSSQALESLLGVLRSTEDKQLFAEFVQNVVRANHTCAERRLIHQP